MSKISIRFFDNEEVRAVWNDEKNGWLFSVVDIVGILTDSKDPRNYWKWLKNKLKNKGVELVSHTNRLKLPATDGKRYLTDCLEQKDILSLVENVPSKKSTQFIKWLTYSDDTIDGQSRTKAYALFESGLLDNIEPGTIKGLQQIHSYLFGGLYDFAGKLRSKNIAKGGFSFAPYQYFDISLKTIETMPEDTFDEIVHKYIEMNVAHPFMEGNGRTTRIWLDLMFKRSLKKCVDWSKIDKNDYLNAMTESVVDGSKICKLLQLALTDKITDREMFLKGIDYSYYYEEN